ncbi:MAG TPA: hypothetical protein VFE46_05595 [Pirellulales bacterium]|nr:hypothetical protein [Pirellulales bacterium]
MPKLPRDLLSQSRVIAKGNRIRDVRRLVRQYGGRPAQWIKKSSPRFSMGHRTYEFHWYEHPGLGRFEIKRKEVS